MHAFDWPEQTLKIYMQNSTYFACNNDLCRAVLTNLHGDVFLSFLPDLSLEETNWVVYHDIKIFLKWGILNVPFYSIFVYVPFHFMLL